MKKIIILFLIFYCTQLLSQEKNIVFSIYNIDSVYYKAEVIKSDSDITVIINIKNNSNSNIYLDTSYIKAYTWKERIAGPIIGIGLSHLSKNDVSESDLLVFLLKPHSNMILKFNLEDKIFEAKFDSVRKYSFEMKYLIEESLKKEFIGKSNFKMQTISYYFLSKRFIIGNSNLDILLSE